MPVELEPREKVADPEVDELDQLRRVALGTRMSTLVSAGTEGGASSLQGVAATDTRVRSVGVQRMQALSAVRSRLEEDLSRPRPCPRYLRKMIWSDASQVPVNADSSLNRTPVPDVPHVVRNNPVISTTIASNPDLFRIVTPIRVDRLRTLLQRHPNKPFVDSVCRALQEGFWPWADPSCGEYPDTHEEKLKGVLNEPVLQFLRDQRDEEIAAERFSPSFGRNLLPGMYSMPIHAVPKPNSDKLRLVTNHSAGPYSLNSMISKIAISGVVMDGVPAIGQALRKFRREHGHAVKLVMWKSDVSQAYRRIPMSPYWQIKQVVTIDGERHVDRNNVFGGRGSERAWDCFCTLVNWAAKYEVGISDIMNYVDDNFCFDIAGNEAFYSPYAKFMPTRQVWLLELWDELGVPHEERKQLSGETLTVIGFEIDPNAMTATLSAAAKSELVAFIRKFCDMPRGGR